MKAYKVFDPDWTCKDFEYEVGKTYTAKGKIIPCENGFHACQKASNCFNYYSFSPNNKCAEVELDGEIIEHGDKLCAEKIAIVREIPWSEMLELCNSGTGNSGYRNSGDWNSGNCNSGYRNSGNWNSGYRNSGLFNTDEPAVRMFNRPTDFKRSEIKLPDCLYFGLTVWVSSDDMSDAEKIEHPEHETTGGYLKTLDYKEAFTAAMQKATPEEIEQIRNLPNFDADVFEEISGFRIKEVTT